MKVVTIVGARPQFIKAAPVSRILRQQHTEILVHTGQHYDDNMSAIFFDELDIPEPDYNLGIGSGSHGAQTGAMLAGIEQVLVKEQPDWLLVYGDTNSTLAGALAAAKLHIKVAHVEAGLRSFNRVMPEEINRVVADHLSDLLLCPSQVAADNLKAEGITRGVHVVGDVMADALAYGIERSQGRSQILQRLGLAAKKYLLVTVHRAENTDDHERLANILSALSSLTEIVVFPMHPRTREVIRSRQLGVPSNVRVIDPVGHLDILQLEANADAIMTDSGGMQKEAYWLGVRCITLRTETEWTETVEAGWNWLVGTDPNLILAAVTEWFPTGERPEIYGDGNAAEKISAIMKEMAA